jgi:hypothetical protein
MLTSCFPLQWPPVPPATGSSADCECWPTPACASLWPCLCQSNRVSQKDRRHESSSTPAGSCKCNGTYDLCSVRRLPTLLCQRLADGVKIYKEPGTYYANAVDGVDVHLPTVKPSSIGSAW